MKRSAPLATPKARKPRTRRRKSNAKRKAERFKAQFLSAERVLWMQSKQCAVVTHGGWLAEVRAPCGGRTHNAHVKSRGAGGTWRGVVPLCAYHHAEQHSLGIREFQDHYGLDLAVIAAEFAAWGPQT